MSERNLVRARPKALEYLPEAFRCCDEAQQCVLGLGEMVLDLSRQRTDRDLSCRFCGKGRMDIAIAAPDVADGLYVSLCVLDLDEGSIDHGR